MFTAYRKRRQLAKVKPGDGSRLERYRAWQLLTRSLFALELPGHVFEVDVRPLADGSTKRSPASLYRDGVQVARSTLPAAFPVPGGVVEVAASQYGLKRIHYVTDDGAERVLTPHPGTQEGLRARFGRRFPRTSAVLAVAAVVAIVVGALVGFLQGLDAVTHSPVIAARFGTFTTPVPLPARIAATVAMGLGATERALTFTSRWLVTR